MNKKPFNIAEMAETVALQMLAFLAADEERLESFLRITGTAPQDLRKLAADPQFLAGVTDHVLADQSLLLTFCEHAGLTPEQVIRARQHLPGAFRDL